MRTLIGSNLLNSGTVGPNMASDIEQPEALSRAVAFSSILYLNVQYNTISFITDDKNKDREVSADTAATETNHMMGIIKI